MIKKITNWVFGSFFRTMGRFFFFLFFGFLIATIISRSNININWTDLFGIARVSAAEIVIPVEPTNYSLYFNTGASSGFNCPNNDYCDDVTKTIYLTSSANVVNDYLTLNSTDTSPFDYIEFTFAITQASANYQIGSTGTMADNVCTSWQESNGLYTCTQISAFGQDQWLNNILNNSMFMFKVDYSDLSGVQSVCTVSGNTIVCPTLRHNISKIYINSYLKTSVNAGSDISFNFYLSRRLKPYISNSTAEAIQNQTQQYIQAQENATQQQIESQLVCRDIDKVNIETNGKFLNQYGNEATTSNYGITGYLNIKGATIKVLEEQITNARASCFYDVNKTLISCITNDNLTVGTYLTIPNNATYFRASINTSTNKPQFEICQNGNQALQNTLDNTDTSEANSTATNFFNNFNDSDNGGISSIITAPLSAISGLANASCTPITLPIPYLDNKQLVLPCMSAIYTEHFGSFFSLYQTIIFGVIAYRMLVSIFMMIQGFKNPDDDKIEVVDL